MSQIKKCCCLCKCDDVVLFCEDQNRVYLECKQCTLVFVPERYWLSLEEEKNRYDLHNNDTHDQGYRQFLSRLSTPLLKKLPPEQKGLDFGCGPGPTLSLLIEEQGHRMELYDPFYYKEPSLLETSYDFICATEVVEHLQTPDKEFETLFSLLQRGGWLGLMTKLVIDKEAFRKWHYIRDLTHICFYSRQTFQYLAHRFHAELHFIANDVILLQK